MKDVAGWCALVTTSVIRTCRILSDSADALPLTTLPPGLAQRPGENRAVRAECIELVHAGLKVGQPGSWRPLALQPRHTWRFGFVDPAPPIPMRARLSSRS